MENKYAEYYNYTEDQFVENEYFQQWVKYANKDNEQFWNGYLHLFPHQQLNILAAQKRVQASLKLQKNKPLSTNEKLILKRNILNHIHPSVHTFIFFQQQTLKLFRYAVIIIPIIFIPTRLINNLIKTNNLITEYCGNNQLKEFILPDSTVVILNANSLITYYKKIGNIQNREISLQGNAFFKVKEKADHRPFIVHAGTLSITVLGTEFNVNARSIATEIVLVKGKVKISLDDKTVQPIYMVPGEKVQLDTIHKNLIKSSANTILYFARTDGKWNFSSTSLLDITNLIYEFYGIETVFNNVKAKQLKISAVIPVTDLGSLINILAKTLDIKILQKLNKLYVQL